METLADFTELVAKDQVISSLRKELSIEDSFEGIIGSSSGMRQVFDLIQSAAQSEAPVIIYGESGTGKELVAGAIHRLSPRSNGPFIKVNCAALNESLLESELFGHVKGAFTGADRTRMGRFEAATKGSIFLDEIGDLPLSTQVKLLRVLQEKEIEKVGDYQPIPVDVRVVAATNRDLNRLMKEGAVSGRPVLSDRGYSHLSPRFKRQDRGHPDSGGQVCSQNPGEDRKTDQRR